MRIKALALLAGSVCFFLSPLQGQQTTPFTINGYVYFKYLNGESQSAYPESTFGDLGAGVIFSGRLAGLFDFSLEPRFKSESMVELEETWVGIYPSDAFHLKGGLYLVPFGKYNTRSRPYQTRYIQTPLPIEHLYPESWRELGVLVEGKTRIFNYSAFIGNGLKEETDLSSGQQFRDNNGEKGWGGRLGFFLSETFEAGISYYQCKYDNAGERKLILEGADVTWTSEAFQVLFEYGRGLIDNPEGFARGKIEGYLILLALNVSDFSPWASYQSSKYRDDFHGPGFLPGLRPGLGIFSESNRWAVGVVYFATANILFKFEYDFNQEKDFELENNLLLVQVALYF